MFFLKLFSFNKRLFLLVLAFQLIFIGLALPTLAKEIQFQPSVGVGSEFLAGRKITVPNSTALLADYFRAIYDWGIGAVGIVAALAMVIGGLIWLTAGGNMGRVGEAKVWIGSALLGIVLALGAYAILKTINPALVNFKIVNIKEISGPDLSDISKISGRPHIENIIGCCLENGNWATCKDVIKANCPAGSTFYWNQKCSQTICKSKTEAEIACAGKGEYDSCRTSSISQGYCEGFANGKCVPCKVAGMSCNDNKVCCSNNCKIYPRVCDMSPSQEIDCAYSITGLGQSDHCERKTYKECKKLAGEICENGCNADRTDCLPNYYQD